MIGERTMITFNAGAWRFKYRVGGVLVRDGQVLLMRIGSEKFWFVPGGRIESRPGLQVDRMGSCD